MTASFLSDDSGPLRVDVPKAGRKWVPQGLPRSDARVHTSYTQCRKAHTAISSASTLTIATALDDQRQRDAERATRSGAVASRQKEQRRRRRPR